MICFITNSVLAFTAPLSHVASSRMYMTQSRAFDSVSMSADVNQKAIDAAAKKLRSAAAAFGKEQRDAADAWLEKTLTRSGVFSSAELLDQQVALFEQCTIDYDGSSNCKTLDDALVDLQSAMEQDMDK